MSLRIKRGLKKAILGAFVIPSLLLTSCANQKTGTTADTNAAGDTTDAAGDVTDNTGNNDNNNNIFDPNAPSTAGGNISDVALETGNLYAVISVKEYGDITVKLFPDIAPIAVENFVNAAKSGYYDGKNFHRIIADFMIQGGSLNGDGASDPDGISYGVEKNPNARHFYGAIAMGKNSLGENGIQFYLVNNKKADEFDLIEAQLPDIESAVNSLKEALDEVDAHIAESGEDGINQTAVLQYRDQYAHYSALLDYVKNSDQAVKDKYKQGGVPFLDGGYTVFGQTVEGFEVIDEISAVEVLPSPGNPNETSKPAKEILIDKVEIKTF